jgi:2-dehydropantoate 2-reductase
MVKIAIVGVGAMGTLFACFLHRAGYTAWLIDNKSEQVNTIRQEGLTVEDAEGTHRIPLYTATTEPEVIGQVDLIVIAVKAYDTKQAMSGAVPLVGDETVVLTLQNGLYNLETIAGIVGKNRVLGGVTAHGATRLGCGHIRHAGSGETVIGSLSGEQRTQLTRVCELLNAAGIRTTTTTDVTGTIWSKLIINAAINPLTALTRLTNGEIIECAELLDVQKRVTEEACAVAATQGITIHYASPVEKVKDVCRATAPNKSSMLQDILNGKKTEIDYINGAIVTEGTACGVSTPYNQILTRLVKAVEIQGPPDAE